MSPRQHVGQLKGQLSQVRPAQLPPSHPPQVPPVPQALAVGGTTHAPVTLSQQPPAAPQRSGWQMHRPFSQRWFDAHTWLPQRHPLGPDAQLSLPGGQLLQNSAVPVRQRYSSTAWHWLTAQQPLGQLAASHTQPPFTHRWPALHGAKVPHRHSPEAPQRSELPTLHCSQTPPSARHTTGSALPASEGAIAAQAPFRQQPLGQEARLHAQAIAVPASAHTWPARHWALGPHWQTPAAHWEESVAGQAAQLAPLTPHRPWVCCA